MQRFCVEVKVSLAVGAEEWAALCERVVPVMRDLPGLEWKLWLLDEKARTAGGVYLFRDESSALTYADGPVLAALREAGVGDVSVRTSPVMDQLSERTWAVRP